MRYCNLRSKTLRYFYMSVRVNLLYTFLILRCRFCASDASVIRVLLIINPLLTTHCSKHQQTRKTTHYALDNAVTRPIRATNGRVLCLLTTMLVATHGISYRHNRKTCDSILQLLHCSKRTMDVYKYSSQYRTGQSRKCDKL